MAAENVYPIMLKLAGRRVVVVGAGPVALRKARALRDVGAQVTIVAAHVGEVGLDGMEVIRQPYEPQLLSGAGLVFACTNDRTVNASIATDARRAGIWVNCVDQPDDCDFYTAAVIRKGQVVVAVSTSGASPSLSVSLKERIAEILPDTVAEFAEALARIRRTLAGRVGDAGRRMEIMRELSGRGGYETFCDGGEHALEELMERQIEPGADRRKG